MLMNFTKSFCIAPSKQQCVNITSVKTRKFSNITLSQFYNKKQRVLQKCLAVRARKETPLMDKENAIINFNISFEPFYRVILQYSNWTDDKDTAHLVKNAVPQLHFNEALRITKQARSTGKSIVMTSLKEEADKYASNLRSKGLDAYLEEA